MKRAKAVGDYATLSLLLGELAAKADLEAIREQKILFGLKQAILEDCSKAVCHAARSIVSTQEISYLENYCRFIAQVADIRLRIDGKFQEALHEIRGFNLGDLIVALDEWLSESYEHISTQLWDRHTLSRNNGDSGAAMEAAESEETFQTVVGNTNEIAFASARLLNEAAATLAHVRRSSTGSKPRRELRDAIPKLICLAQDWNNTQVVIDKVSYGEWRVENITADSCSFAMVDSRLNCARILGLRREAVQRKQKIRSRKYEGTFIGKNLGELLPSFLDSMLDHLCGIYQIQIKTVDYWDIRNRLKTRLLAIDAEDDLLLVAAGAKSRSVQYDYIACMALRWYMDLIDWLSSQVSRRKLRTMDQSAAPAASVVKFLPVSQRDRRAIQESLEEYCSAFPRKNFYSILDQPFSIFADGTIACVPTLDAGQWTTAIRSKWIQHGDIGHQYGHAWENFLAWSLEQHDWRILARNINLKNGGKRDCEIDFLIGKDDVCLVVQLKAFAGQGANMYDHWRNRQTIEKGVHQAKAAVEILTSAYRLSDVVGKTAAQSIRVLRPLVISTLHYFNGWQSENVSILSVSALDNLVRGAPVEFRRGTGEVVCDPTSRPTGNLTGSELVGYLDYPLDWRISQGTDVFTQKSAMVEGVSWSMPLAGGDGEPFEIHASD